MDKNEVMGILYHYVTDRIKLTRELSGVKTVKPEYIHLGDEYVDGIESQWWRVTFDIDGDRKTYVIHVSYSKYLDLVQVEHFEPQGRNFYESWAVDYLVRTAKNYA